MKYSSLASGLAEKDSESGMPADRFYSVEFSVDGVHFLHQFKIWNIADSSMSFLVKEGSEILERMKEGDVINMKYYSVNAFDAAKLMNTKIRNITRENQGKFRGHYFVKCAIMGN